MLYMKYNACSWNQLIQGVHKSLFNDIPTLLRRREALYVIAQLSTIEWLELQCFYLLEAALGARRHTLNEKRSGCIDAQVSSTMKMREVEWTSRICGALNANRMCCRVGEELEIMFDYISRLFITWRFLSHIGFRMFT